MTAAPWQALARARGSDASAFAVRTEAGRPRVSPERVMTRTVFLDAVRCFAIPRPIGPAPTTTCTPSAAIPPLPWSSAWWSVICTPYIRFKKNRDRGLSPCSSNLSSLCFHPCKETIPLRGETCDSNHASVRGDRQLTDRSLLTEASKSQPADERAAGWEETTQATQLLAEAAREDHSRRRA